jgi:hypothetical protein
MTRIQRITADPSESAVNFRNESRSACIQRLALALRDVLATTLIRVDPLNLCHPRPIPIPGIVWHNVGNAPKPWPDETLFYSGLFL